ncbi:MAG: HlyD family secretion protein [Gammaproteobacteria bacterium]
MRTAWLWTAIVLLLIAGGSYGLYVYLKPAPLPAQLLYGNGHVEGTEVKVAAEVAGRVVESRLVEGRTVTAGALLVRLDDTDPRLNKARAEAEADALGQERERLERELQVWRHHLRTAESDLARYQELKERGTVPPQRLEQAENAFREAQGRVAALEAGIGAIDKRITAARRELDLLVNQIVKTSISAPLGATILIKAVEPGEFVQPGQTVATLLDLRRAELKVFIPERDIAKVKLSALARVRVDAYPDRMFEARVARVDQAAQFTPRDIHMPEERVRLVFGVTLSLDNPDGALKPGMPADAWILWQSAAGWPERLFVPE